LAAPAESGHTGSAEHTVLPQTSSLDFTAEVWTGGVNEERRGGDWPVPPSPTVWIFFDPPPTTQTFYWHPQEVSFIKHETSHCV